MPCRSPILISKKGHLRKIPVPCGKCPQCRKRKVDEWVFRLLQEGEVSSSSFFITLTYKPKTVPRSPNNFMTLKKADFQNFMKRLRKLQSEKIKYYAVGEYGSKRQRPHYHAIIFNVQKDEFIRDAWTLNNDQIGTVHIGRVSSDSIAYTCKYMDKGYSVPKHSRDDRSREFSLMSKGLGKSFITEKMKKFYNSNLSINYVWQNGYKKPMPRYFRNKILTESNAEKQIEIIRGSVTKRQQEKYRQFLKKNGMSAENVDYNDYINYIKAAESYTFFKNFKSRDYD